MQTFSDALVNLVLEEMVDREVAANAASNRHDFLIALERALKEQAVKAEEFSSVADPEEASEPEAPGDEAGDEIVQADELPRLRVAGQQ
jgi:hypothetical protein